MSPLISVILPVFNAEKYISAAILSVLKQDFSDFELVVIDDGSTDHSLSLIQEIALTDSRIRIITRPNQGLIYSLNEGISLAKGKWIARMDADDICLPNRFSKQLEWLTKTGADVCGTWIRAFGDTLPRVRRFYIHPATLDIQLLFNTCCAHPTIMAKRAILLQNRYNVSAKYAEDYDLWIRLASKGVRFTNYPGVGLHYRVHNQQVTTAKLQEHNQARSRVAKRHHSVYSFPISEQTHADIMSRSVLLSSNRINNVVDFFDALYKHTNNPEGVVVDNAFLFLARHAEFGLRNMRNATKQLPFSVKQKTILLTLAGLRADQRTSLYNFLYRLR